MGTFLCRKQSLAKYCTCTVFGLVIFKNVLQFLTFIRVLCDQRCTANEGPVKIQYKCLVPIYVFPEMKLLFPKQNYNVLSPSSYTHISVRNVYISRIDLPSAAGKYMDQSWEHYNCSQTHECGNWDWGRATPRKGIHKWNFLCSTRVRHSSDGIVVRRLAGINESHFMKISTFWQQKGGGGRITFVYLSLFTFNMNGFIFC